MDTARQLYSRLPRADLYLISADRHRVIGMFYLFAPQIREVSFSDSVFFGFFLALVSALIASFGNMVSQATQRAKLPVVQTNAWAMCYGTIIISAFSIANGHEFTFEWTASYIISLCYLTVFGSIIAFGAYLTLLGRIGAAKAGYAMVMFPVFAVLLSALFEGLEITATTVFGTLFVIAGNGFVLYTRQPVADAPDSSKASLSRSV